MEDAKNTKDINDIKERLTRIEVMLTGTLETRKLEMDRLQDGLSNLKTESDFKDKMLEDRISRLENQSTWLWRTIAGFIIGSVLAVIIKK